ncbi:MAG: LLM class flavin-dependent oxidoreductase [Promethearchaeota archaeon]
MDIDNIKIGTEGTFIPPFERGIETIKRIEKIGYDSVWFADHLMGWIPESIWTPDLIKMAEIQKSPHDFYDVFSTMSVAAWNTQHIYLGTSVTETFRRHPAVLAQIFLTQNHISKGRTILGIGTGEGENIIPYGIKWEKPVSRLEEAIKIIKLLWESDEKVNYDGNFWKLKDAVLSIKPFEEGKYPPIWIAAHGPKMCELTGRLGDGWLPSNLNLKDYKERFDLIFKSAKQSGRNPNEIIPGLWSTLIIDDEHGECDDLLETPYAKNYCLLLPSERFKQFGVSHPLGKNFYGLLEYFPASYDKETMLEAIDKVPLELCEDNFLHGTPDEIIGRIEEYAKIGLKHIVLYNMTYCCDVTKIKSSFSCLKKVLDYFKN